MIPAVPFEPFDYVTRLKRAGAEAAGAGLDAVVITSGPDLIYLAGYDPPPLERLTALLVRPDAEPVLVVPVLERPRAERSPGAAVIEIVGWRDGECASDAVRGVIGGRARHIAASERMWAVHLLGLQAAFPRATFASAAPILAPLRARKEPGELELLRRAGRAADAAFALITAERLAGRTEADVARSLAAHLLDSGHESVGFTIVASGANGASPHHAPGDRTIREGDFVVLDFGGRIGGYCSDITRTVSVGEPDDEGRKVYDIVRLAQQAAFDAAVEGTPAEDVDRAARRVIEEAGFGDSFVHRTGHGIGLEEHEEPYLVQGNARTLEPGNCFSIEPGIYLAGRFGVRIEDIVALTGQGPERLNEAPRELTVVG